MLPCTGPNTHAHANPHPKTSSACQPGLTDPQSAFFAHLSKCASKISKWYRDLVIGKTVVTALEKLKMKYPEPERDFSDIEIKD